jgi:hypothetical protein
VPYGRTGYLSRGGERSRSWVLPDGKLAVVLLGSIPEYREASRPTYPRPCYSATAAVSARFCSASTHAALGIHHAPLPRPSWSHTSDTATAGAQIAPPERQSPPAAPRAPPHDFRLRLWLGRVCRRTITRGPQSGTDQFGVDPPRRDSTFRVRRLPGSCVPSAAPPSSCSLHHDSRFPHPIKPPALAPPPPPTPPP